MIDALIGFFDQHDGAFTFLCTMAVAVFTGYLFWETRRFRKAATEPRLEVNLAINEPYPELVDMVVKNSGEGAAENIKWYLSLDEEDLDRREVPI